MNADELIHKVLDPVERWAQRQGDPPKILVERGPSGYRRFAVWIPISLVIAVVALVTHGHPDAPGWLEFLSVVVLSTCIGLGVASSMNSARAYRTGWLDGRRALVEHLQRDDSLETTIASEMHHDAAHVLGQGVTQ